MNRGRNAGGRNPVRLKSAIYRGERHVGPHGEVFGVKVRVGLYELLPMPSRHTVRDFSQNFEWGYGGAGAAQLAAALIFDATGEPRRALAAVHWFKWAVVSQWPDVWQLPVVRLLEWLEQFDREGDDDGGDREPVDVTTEYVPARPSPVRTTTPAELDRQLAGAKHVMKLYNELREGKV